jgi:hypothetical protein
MGERTVFQRSDGRWCAKYKDARGTWKYIYRSTKAEAKKALRAALKGWDPSLRLIGKYPHPLCHPLERHHPHSM